MSPTLAVLDSSPLIIFHEIGRLDLLRELFHSCVVPPGVRHEVAPTLGVLPPWISVRQPPPIPTLVQGLGRGEREAIALAIQLSADVIVLDDLAGRRRAVRLGLNVTGSAGLLVLARQRGLIEAVRANLDAMLASGLYVSEALYHQILALVAETTDVDVPR